MLYESELKFLCDTFKKIRVRAITATPSDLSTILAQSKSILPEFLSEKLCLSEILGNLEDCTVYKTSDSLRRCYTYFLLPSCENSKVLFIGPYLSSPISASEALEIGEKNRISPKSQRFLSEYYSSIPVLSEDCHVFAMLDTFCEKIWNSPSFSIIDTGNDGIITGLASADAYYGDTLDDISVNMKALETRYEFENEIIRAVSLGQIHKEKRLIETFSGNLFEKRNADPLRNAKNYCIIMNTLLRKAAESGGVHPVYLDKISSGFASKIEFILDLSDIPTLMREMFTSYCRLVRKHSMKDMSLVVQKTVLIIESDLSANLTLSSISEHLGVSSGYLSTIFKKEVGQTLSGYIQKKRIKHAQHLLSTTSLQVQTVALHCGIMDVQYFSKIFKKQTGMTPNEYRKTVKA